MVYLYSFLQSVKVADKLAKVEKKNTKIGNLLS